MLREARGLLRLSTVGKGGVTLDVTLEAPEADRIATANGVVYAERMVKVVAARGGFVMIGEDGRIVGKPVSDAERML